MPSTPTFDHVICTEFNNGDGVLVDLNTKRYYQLNETATFVWKALEQGRSVEEIVTEMTSVYDVSPEHAAESLNRVLQEFRTRKLLEGE
jgi:hypothetical protein